ncbi:hypothetical protein [Actinomadura chibensis]|uniref:hypothetical protein n=1 Tax=Actinomadura chibensis TaxID=392828 RepID=UPI0012F74ABF|nr:hypothetical protein [Actinomadura chibensis]
MKIRLAGGVVASGRAAWAARPAGPARLPDGADARPGEPVALGPDGADDADVRHAVAELSRLVADGGAVAAGAGVDLGAGFRSARLAGARGDQRDAVLAALRAVGPAGAARLGERSAFLVALFGPAVTKPVGAAAGRAAAEGRWAALHLAAAASDVLGPEQLERVLALDAGEAGDAAVIPGGPPSALARHLRQVLEPVPRRRRLDLITDLWGRVLDHHAAAARRQRRLATQSRRGRVDALRLRRRHDEDAEVLWRVRMSLRGREPSLGDAARWVPDEAYVRVRLDRLLQDALGATALLRTAVAVADHGPHDGLARSADLLAAASALVDEQAAGLARRRVPGLTGLPSRPAPYLRDLHRRVSGGGARDAKLAAYVQPRLASARDLALLIVADAAEAIGLAVSVRTGAPRRWAAADLRSWRGVAGYGRPPAGWAGIPKWTNILQPDTAPLYERLAADPDPAAAETVGDLLWYADLVDALARVHGHERAAPTPGTGEPWFEHDPEPPPADPLAPRLDSVTLAASGAAQLVALGGVPPRHARTWPDLTAALLSGTAIAEALTGEFAVPAPLLERDGAAVPGAGVRVRIARTARDLSEWADFMGNCIASPGYVEDARKGRSGLAGLYDARGALVANAELWPLRPGARGWRVSEIAARFNDEPDAELERRFRAWVASIPGAVPDAPAGIVDEPPPVRPARRRGAPRLVEEVGPALEPLARDALPGPGVLAVFAAVAATPPDAALVRLRRLGAAQLAGAVRRALDTGAADLGALWTATGRRPLAAALDALDPALRERFDRLPLLLDEPPLPKTLRRLVKLPGVADAYALDLAGRRIRRAVGRLAGQDDPVLARAVARHAAEPLLCALTVAVTCAAPDAELCAVAAPGAATVPGYPVTTLADEDGPWRRALPAARELGADTGRLSDEVAAHGLRVPASWLGAGGWPALWARAHSRR